MSACSRILLALVCVASAGVLHAATLAEAQELYRAKRYAEARTAFAQVAAADPDNADAAYHLGQLALMHNEQEEAVKWLEKATTLAPRSSPYFKALGDAYGLSAQKAGLFSQLGFARKCLAAYEKGVALNPQNVSARYALFNFYRSAPAFIGGGVDKARTQAQEIQKLDAVRGTLASSNSAWPKKSTTKLSRPWRICAAAIPKCSTPATRSAAWRHSAACDSMKGSPHSRSTSRTRRMTTSLRSGLPTGGWD